MDTSTILIIGGVVVAGAGIYWGIWPKVFGTAEVKINKAIDGASSASEKAQMRVNQLRPLLESLGQQMTDLDGKFGRANGELNRAQAAFDAEVAGLQNVRKAIADEANMTADESTTRQRHLDKVRAAKALVEAKKTEIAGLAAQAKTLHDQYAEKEAEFNDKVSQIPGIQARETVIASKQTAVAFAAKQKQFEQAAAAGADINSQLDEAEAKADGELARVGGTTTDTDKKAKAQTREAADAALLAELDGKK